MLTLIGDICSRLRTQVKSVKQDAFLTDRYLFSLVRKHAAWLLRRQDGNNRIMRFNPIFQALTAVELIEVNAVEAQCLGIRSEITFMRTRERIPTLMLGYYGPLIRAVTTVDGSERFEPTMAGTYANFTRQKTFRYNKRKYYWFLDGYLYFPNTHVEAVRIEGLFDDDISRFNCGEGPMCVPRQQGRFYVPDYLHGEIESNVLKDLGLQLQIPVDPTADNQHPLRP